VLAVLAWWVAGIARAGRGRRAGAAARLVFHTLAVGAGVYLVFLGFWGLNYLRQPLTSKLDYDAKRLTPRASHDLMRSAIERLNAEVAAAHRTAWPGDAEIRRDLRPSFDATVLALGNRRTITPARAKTSLADWFLAASGTGGVTNPLTHEITLNSTLLPFERPFTIAHEWAHLAGFADESEANFVALLACARSHSPAMRYSAWLDLIQYLPIPTNGARRTVVDTSAPGGEDLPLIAPQVLVDLDAIRDRIHRTRIVTISRFSSRLYDHFLKANRVRAGVESYGLFVRLLIGTRFEREWVPALRARGE
jgi:hypothetical protein